MFPPTRLARAVLVAFLITFICTRMLVFLIMAHRIPDLYLYIGETHVHHLNYGILLIAAVCAYLLFVQPKDNRTIKIAAIGYGIGLALTFDEFGMWLHLGGSYWQRASFDAITVVGAVLALIGYTPWSYVARLPRRWWTAVFIAVLVAVFFVLLVDSFRFVGNKYRPALERIEEEAPK
jgi:hypothetical protein